MLKNYLWEIFALAQENDVDADTGVDLLAHNLENMDNATFYNGADELDYPSLIAQWENLTQDEKANAKNEARIAILENYDALTAAWREENRAVFDAVGK